MKRILSVFWVLILCMAAQPKSSSCAVKERLLDPYYARNLTGFTFRLLYGGANSSTTNRALNDVRGGGIEFEYDMIKASTFFSGVIGLGYLSLDDSSYAQQHFLKGLFLKLGFNLIVFSFPDFMSLKLGPDVRLVRVGVTDKNNQAQSYLGLGAGLNLAVDVSIKPKWFVGGGIREGILNFGNEELKTRYLFIHLQRTF